MKAKQKTDTVINSFLSIIGILIIILGIIKYSDTKMIFSSVMFSYALLNLIQFLLTIKSKDFEGLYTFLASLTVGILTLFLDFNSVNSLTICVLAWTTMMAVIKFIKTDYYNDRKDKMYKLRIISLVLFVIVGVLVSMSLNYSLNVQVLILGYFFLIHGILELIDPITKYLIGN